MGKLFVLVVAVAVGYSLGFRDAQKNPEHILTRAVEQIRVTFGAKPANDVDAVMNKLEGKN